MFKKLFYRLVIGALLFALAAPFVLKGPDGQPLMTFKEAQLFNFSLYKARYNLAMVQLKQRANKYLEQKGLGEIPEIDGFEQAEDMTTIYKWVDENGEINFSDSRSKKYRVEELKINPNQNLLSFEDLKKQAEEGASDEEVDKEKEVEEKRKKVERNYFERMTSVLDDASEVQGLIDKNHDEKLNRLNQLK